LLLIRAAAHLKRYTMTIKTEKIFRDRQFSIAISNPSAWLFEAGHLKKAADRICWLDQGHQEIEDPDFDFSFLYPIYRMLIGFSFENLLKGILLAQDAIFMENGEIGKTFTTHNIGHLLSQINDSQFKLTSEEKKILIELEKYVVWQGRYPVPKKKERYKLSVHSTPEHLIEQELWKKINDYLIDSIAKSISKKLGNNHNNKNV